MKFDPKQTVYGVRLDYVHRFDKWVDGLYAAFDVPFVHITNDLNMHVEQGTPSDSTDVNFISIGHF